MQLNHPNIVKCYNSFSNSQTKELFLVMEYCSKGDLQYWIKDLRQKNNYYTNEKFVWKVIRQIASALNYCHENTQGKILHRDIKPANILIDSNGNVKLGDFGVARQLGANTYQANTSVGTPAYMSPECLKAQPYDEKSDIWSLGCLCYELVALNRPFEGLTFSAVSDNIIKHQCNPLPNTHHSKDLCNLIDSMMSVDPKSRPNTASLVQSCTGH